MDNTNDTPPELGDVLARARRGLSPSAQDAERVLHATLARVVAAAPTAASLPLPAGAPLLHKLVAAALIALGSGGVGFVLGMRHTESGAPEPAVLSAPVASAPAVEVRTPEPRELKPREPEPAPAASVPKPTRHARTPAESSPEPTPTAAPTLPLTLSEELEVMKRVERALREQQPDVALALLDALDQRESSGTLAEERAAASTIARCSMGLGLRATLRERFVTTYSRSAYRARVEAACASKVTP